MAMSEGQIDALAEREFPVTRSHIYLNHAGIGPIAGRTASAACAFAIASARHGARDYPLWVQTETRLRAALARLVNAPDAGDIALLKSTSEGLSVVAHGFPWRSGDNVVVTSQEFPSNRVVWDSLAGLGVTVRVADLMTGVSPESAVLDAIDANTRLVAVSAVQFATGLRMDLQVLGAACRDQGVAFCVDAIQAVGAIVQDVQKMNIDFLVADGHKWMLAPEGLALFYCSADWRSRLSLHQFGWHMRERADDFENPEWQPAASARRFECGSSNMLGIHTLLAAVELLEEIGIPAIERRVLARSAYLLAAVDQHKDLVRVTSDEPGRYAGIVTFQLRREPVAEVFGRLRDHGVICAQRAGGIRFSPHFYTPLEQLDQAMALL